MPRLRLLLLAALAVGATAQAQAPDDRLAGRAAVTLLTAVDLPAPIDLAVEPVGLAAVAVSPMAEAPDLPAVEVIDASGENDLIAVALDEPAPVEDLSQFRAPRAPVRMELAQTRRRVVLLPGVAAREPVRDAVAFDAADAPLDSSSHVIYSRAMVVVGESGRREVRYVTARAAALDLGSAGCTIGTVPSGLQLRGLRVSPLRRGMSGDAVQALQTLLCAAGYAVDSDGVFDGELDQTVRQFQRDHNASGRGRTLTVDGAFGYRTRQAVEAAIASQ